MKLVVPVQLYPSAAGEAALRETLARCNDAATLVSARAFELRVTGKQALQRLVYADLKAMGLSAQPAIHVARKVSGAYAALRAGIPAGNPGKPGSERQVKARSRPIVFQADAGAAAALRRPVPVLATGPAHRQHLDHCRTARGNPVRLLRRPAGAASPVPAG